MQQKTKFQFQTLFVVDPIEQFQTQKLWIFIDLTLGIKK